MKRFIYVMTAVFMMCLFIVSASAKTVLLGDIDLSGRVTASDARTALRASAQLDVLTDEQTIIADADKNGKITSADARKILRCAAGLETPDIIQLTDTVYVNRFMDDNDELELYIAGCEVKKQDGFVFNYKDEIYILDGGMKNTGDDSVYSYLCNLRASLLPEGADETDENFKLKITVVISHFHTDHMNTYVYDIIPSPYFEIETVYMPERSVFEHTEYFSDASYCALDYYTDGVIETKGRQKFLNILSEYSPDTEIVIVDFGEVMQIKSDDGQLVFDLFAPSEDWGTASKSQKLLELYFDGGKASKTATDFPKSVVNSNSMWMKVTYKDRTMLFTGDVMKRAKNAYSPDSENYVGEPFDVMLSYYAEKCGKDVFDVDIVKFPHHGHVRAEASKGVFDVFKPEFVICTAMNFRETTVENAQKFWNAYKGSYCLSDGNGMHIYTDGKYVSVEKNNGAAQIFDAEGKKTGIKGEILVKCN